MIYEPEWYETCCVWVACEAAVPGPRLLDNLLPMGFSDAVLQPRQPGTAERCQRITWPILLPMRWWELGFLFQYINSATLALKNWGFVQQGTLLILIGYLNWNKRNRFFALIYQTGFFFLFSFPVINFLKCKVTSLKWKRFIACQEQSLPNLRHSELKLLKHIRACL